MAVRGGISVSKAEELAAQISEILKEGVLQGDVVKLQGLGALRTSTLQGEAWDPQQRRRVRRNKRVIRFKGKQVADTGTEHGEF